jgi:hypothetical protein
VKKVDRNRFVLLVKVPYPTLAWQKVLKGQLTLLLAAI